MKQVYEIDILSGKGFDGLWEAVEKLDKWLEEKSNELLRRLSEEGYNIASAKFSKAAYDGTNDTRVSVEERKTNVRAVVAVGSAVLFIEFGTGVKYPDDHPEAAKNGMTRGGYGHHLGRLESGWRYPESHGRGTSATPDPDHPGYLHTFGNPANMPMYETVKELKEKLPVIVREVFGCD